MNSAISEAKNHFQGAVMAIPNPMQNQKTADLTELVGTQLFKQVSMAQVAALLRFCPTLTLSNGDKLIVPGQTVDKVHLLLQGSMQVFENEPNEKPIGQIRQGECVGLSSFVDRQPCHVSIVSEGISRLLVLDEERLTALINTPTAVSRNMLFMLMNYLRQKAARATQPAIAPAASPTPNNHIDALTGLHNQRWLDETLDRLILRAATDRAPLSLLAVDWLDVPGLTAEYGQEMLDMALPEVAKALSNSLRPTDLIARHANGRFVILLPNTSQEDAAMVSTRVQESVNSTEIVIPRVCVLPPMKIVMGATTMSAFVSSRKLVGDAFAALEQNRATLLAVMMAPPIETPVEPESLTAEESSEPLIETQTEEAIDLVGPTQPLAEALPAPMDNFTTETAAEIQPEGNSLASAPPEPASEAKDNIITDDANLSQGNLENPPHLAA